MRFFAGASSSPYRFRNYMEVFFLFDRLQMTKDGLCQEFAISLKTLNKDIDLMQRLAIKFGARLVITGDLIECKVQDRELFFSYLNNCRVFFYRHRHNINDYKIRLAKMILVSLISGKELSNNTIAERLGYTVSNLRSEFKRLSDFYNSFGLDHKTALDPQNKEFNRRIAIISALMYMDHRLMFLEYHESSVVTFLNELDDLDQGHIKTDIIEILKRYNIVTTKQDLSMIKNYLVISILRYSSSHTIRQADEPKDFSDVASLKAAEEILRRQDISNDKEIHYLAFIIDILHKRIDNIDTHGLDHLILSYLDDKWNITITPQQEQMLKNEIRRLVLKNYQDFLGFQIIPLRNNPIMIYMRPLFAKMSYDILKMIKGHLQKEIHLNACDGLMRVLNVIINEVTIPQRPIKVYIMMNSSYQDAAIRAQLSHIINLQIESAEATTMIDEGSIVISEDTIIKRQHDVTYLTTFQGLGLRIPEYINKRASHSYDLHVLDELKIIRHDLTIDRLDGFFNIINKNYHLALDIELFFLRNNSYRDTIAIVLNGPLDGKDTLIFGELTKSISFDHKVYHNYMIICFAPSSIKIKLFNQLTQDLLIDQKNFAALLADPSSTKIKELLSLHIF